MRSFAFAGVLFIGAITTVQAAPISVLNSSFETPVQASSGYTYNPANASWTFVGSSGIAAQNSPFYTAATPDGTQAAFIQNNGYLTQNVSGFIQSASYIITFSLAGRMAPYGSNPVDVTIGGTDLGVFTPTADRSFSSYSATFVATGTSELLSFIGQASSTSSDVTTLLDNIKINSVALSQTAVPEPASLALLGSALSFAGLIRRRKAK